MSIERRCHVRVAPEEGYFLRCTVPIPSGPPVDLSTRLVDVSPGGVGLQTLAPVGENTSVDLSIILPGLMARFRARGVVRWSVTREYGATRAPVHYAGVRIEAVEEADGRATDWLGGAKRSSRDPQRRHARFRPVLLEAGVLPRTLARRLKLRGETAAVVSDLSLGGAQVVVDERLEPGATAEFRLRSERPAATLTAQVEIRWCRRDTRVLAPRWTAGLRFRGMAAADANALRRIDRYYLG